MADDSSTAFDESKIIPLDEGAEPLGGQGAEFKKPLSFWQKLPEQVAGMEGMVGGGAAGAAAGGAVGGPPGAIIGGIAGMTLGQTGVDALNAELNEKLYGTPADLSPSALKENLTSNAIASTAGEAMGGIGGKMVTQPIVGGVEEAMAKQGAENFGEQAALGKGYETAEKNISEGAQDILQEGKQNIEAAPEKRTAEVYKSPESKARVQEQNKLAEEQNERAEIAHQSGIRGATGVTPEETEASLHAKGPMATSGVELPSPELIQRRRGLADAAFGPSHQIQEEIGSKFDQRLADHMDTDVDVGGETDGLRATAGQVRQWAKDEGYTLSPAVNKLLGKVDKAGVSENGLFDLTAKHFGMSPEDFSKLPVTEQQTYVKSVAKSIKNGQLGNLSPEEAQKLVSGSAESSTVAKPRELLGLRREASALSASEPSAVGRSAANDIVDNIDNHLGKSGIPGMDDLRAEYATHKAMFGRDFYRDIARAKDPIDAAPAIFNNKDVGATLYRSGSPDQQAYLRRLYGDWVNESFANKGKSVIDWGTQRDFLKEAFPGTVLVQPQTWKALPANLIDAGKILSESPEVTEHIQALVQQDVQNQALAASNDIAKLVAEQAQKLGPPGKSILEAIGKAPPMDRGAVALKAFYGKTPTQMAQELAGGQISQEGAGQMALASKQLGGSEGKGYMARMMGSVRNRLALYAAVAGAGALTSGHASPFMVGAAALGTIDMGREGLTKALSDVLSRNPDAAAAFVKAIRNPTSELNQQVISKALSGHAVSDAIQKFTGYGDLEKPPKPADVNDVATHAAVKSKEGGVRAIDPGESHDDAIRRTGATNATKGFLDKEGNFIDRKEAQAQVKGLGGKDEPPHSDDIALGPKPDKPEPVSLGSSPVRKLVSGWLDADPKGATLRDLDDAAREYRRGNVPAMDPQKWLAKGLTPSEIARGYKLSGMSRMDAALSQLTVPQLTEAWKIAEKTHDANDGNRIKVAIAKQLKEGAWTSMKPEEKKRVAEAMRDIYAPGKGLNEA